MLETEWWPDWVKRIGLIPRWLTWPLAPNEYLSCYTQWNSLQQHSTPRLLLLNTHLHSIISLHRVNPSSLTSLPATKHPHPFNHTIYTGWMRQFLLPYPLLLWISLLNTHIHSIIPLHRVDASSLASLPTTVVVLITEHPYSFHRPITQGGYVKSYFPTVVDLITEHPHPFYHIITQGGCIKPYFPSHYCRGFNYWTPTYIPSYNLHIVDASSVTCPTWCYLASLRPIKHCVHFSTIS